MYLYNVTIIVENGLQEAVKQHIETQFFAHRHVDGRLSLLEMVDSPHQGVTYCIQLRAGARTEIAVFQQEYLTAFQESVRRDYPGKVLFFESVMKYLND